MTHRHRRANLWMPIEEAVDLMAQHGPLWSIQGPFLYCEICQCIPTSFTGPDPEDHR
jgi:hypothetical protein